MNPQNQTQKGTLTTEHKKSQTESTKEGYCQGRSVLNSWQVSAAPLNTGAGVLDLLFPGDRYFKFIIGSI